MGYVDLVLKLEGQFQRWYAIKRLHQHYRSDPGLRAMFVDEARLAGLLRHPNIVSVHDVGEDEDGPFLMMDFVDGVPIAKVIAQAGQTGQPIPLQVAVRIAMEAARGLHAAHEAKAPDGTELRLIHRDVSPQNVLIGFDGGVRLTDFGIAKAIGNSSRTTTGFLKANMGYASPEQLRFEEVDRRSDLFSLGVTLFELLSGERLYENRQGLDGPRRILTEPAPDLGDFRSEAPLDLVELCFELLAKDRERRPATAGEVAARLEAVLAQMVADEGSLELAEYMRLHFEGMRAAQETRLAILRDQAIAREARARSRGRRRLAGAAIGVVLVAAGGFAAWRHWATAPAAVSAVWAGSGWHTCAAQGGTFFCWGKNNEGQLGIGSTRDRTGRWPLSGVRDVVSAAIGTFHTCACTARGELYCWGRNLEGQLGNGGTSDKPALEPVRVAGACKQVAAGWQHACALRPDGTVACWGDNRHGQVGVPPSPSVTGPTVVAGVSGAIQVAANGDFSCARFADGTASCWGANNNGQLGDGSTVERPSPAPVHGLGDAAELALGEYFACARRQTGGIVCWGRNRKIHYDGTPADHSEPVAVPGMTDAVQISTGLDHLCALRASGELRCLGTNERGQLGDGTQRNAAAFVTVSELHGVLSVSAGDVHTCATVPGGVSCWGLNETGQLGDGSKDTRTRPVSAIGF